MSAALFYFLSMLIVIFSLAVVLLPNPIYSALSLAVTMVSLGFMYYLLNAPFIAGVQLIVYAGAVMVLFVMVLMLFDLKKEEQILSGNALGHFLKFGACAAFVLLLAWGATQTLLPAENPMQIESAQAQLAGVKVLATKLFTQYVFAFEALGVLLLLIAVGVVAVSRAKGGTHARD